MHADTLAVGFRYFYNQNHIWHVLKNETKKENEA